MERQKQKTTKSRIFRSKLGLFLALKRAAKWHVVEKNGIQRDAFLNVSCLYVNESMTVVLKILIHSHPRSRDPFGLVPCINIGCLWVIVIFLQAFQFSLANKRFLRRNILPRIKDEIWLYVWQAVIYLTRSNPVILLLFNWVCRVEHYWHAVFSYKA